MYYESDYIFPATYTIITHNNMYEICTVEEHDGTVTFNTIYQAENINILVDYLVYDAKEFLVEIIVKYVNIKSIVETFIKYKETVDIY